MPLFLASSKLIGSGLLRRNGIMQFIRSAYKTGQKRNYVPIRCWRSIAGSIDKSSERKSAVAVRDLRYILSNVYNNSPDIQRRSFLGCGDGEEGNALSKVHEERRVMGYSPEQLFAVVSAVDLYGDFIPWCQRSDIVRQYPDGSFDAELEIGFKFMVESYVSHVVLDKPRRIKTTSSQSTLFEHLINVWEFNPGPTPETCNLYFMVDFKFQSPLYRQVASMFFKEVVSRLVTSFNDRCRLVYGPEARVLEQNA